MSLLEKEKIVLSTIERKKQEIIDFLQQLGRIPSISGEASYERECQDLICKKLEKIKCDVDIWEPDIVKLRMHPAYVHASTSYKGRPNIVGTLRGAGNGKSMILNGHVDVVTAKPEDAWHYDPWGSTIEGDYMYGRGIADMKSGVVSMIMAVECIKEANVKLKGDVIIQSVLDEEVGGDGTLACILRGYKGDGAIVTEPSGLEINPAQSGGHVFKISVKGRSAHVGFKYEGISAMEKASKIINALNNLEKQRNATINHPLFECYPLKVPLNVGIVRSGEWIGIIPEEAILEGVFTCLPNEDLKNVRKDFENTVYEAAIKDSWMKQNMPVIEWSHFFIEPAEIPANHDLVKTFSDSVEKVTEKESIISGFPSGCDMRLLIKYANTPTLIFGPGSLKQGHIVDEYIRIDELIDSTKTIAISLLNWCGIAS